jgi:diguanylate cyclase (GGDEF)-like protein
VVEEFDNDYDDDMDTTRVTDGPDEELLGALKNMNFYLVVIAGNQVGEMCRIEGQADIGRDKKAHVRIVDEGISRIHCRARQLPMGKLLVEDLRSTNGTFVNGERIDKQVLQDGDKIQIGSNTVLRFAYTDGLDEGFQRQMYDSALRDGLTKAYNKRFYSDRIEMEFATAKRTGSVLALVMMDIDHFKNLNDNWGHPAGDMVLRDLVQVVLAQLGEDDIFCRYGGEEFTLITHTHPVEAVALGDRIREAIADHVFTWESERLPVTMSMGVACMPAAAFATHDALLGAADSALYVSKEGGRNRVTLHDASSG